MGLRKRPHKEDIKAAIRKKGCTLKSVSLEAGLEETTVARSLLKPIPRANRAVADLLGRPLHILWPDWYDQQGKRIPHRNSPKPTPISGERHRKKLA